MTLAPIRYTALSLAIAATSLLYADVTALDAESISAANTQTNATLGTTQKADELLTVSFTPKQYSAEYQSEYQGRKVKGTRSLIKSGKDWVLQTKLKKLMISITEEAEVAFEGNTIKPKRYEYRRSIFGNVKRQSLDYDYDKLTVQYNDGDDESGNYALLPQSFDKSSQQFLIEEHLRRGSTEFTSNHAARNRSKIQSYRVLGEEYIELPIGVTKAIKVEIVPDPRNKRHTVMWFDPERHYLLVQLKQTDKKGKSYTMRLSDVKFLD